MERLLDRIEELEGRVKDLERDTYGDHGGDRQKSILNMVQSLWQARALGIWVVSLATGIGSTIVAAYVINLIK